MKDAGKVIIVRPKKIIEINVDELWKLIEDYADSKVSTNLANEVSYGQTAIDAEVKYDEDRAEFRKFLGLKKEKD